MKYAIFPWMMALAGFSLPLFATSSNAEPTNRPHYLQEQEDVNPAEQRNGGFDMFDIIHQVNLNRGMSFQEYSSSQQESLSEAVKQFHQQRQQMMQQQQQQQQQIQLPVDETVTDGQ
jgi:predicted PolB exonuclease-like 3'-5' exonuclease